MGKKKKDLVNQAKRLLESIVIIVVISLLGFAYNYVSDKVNQVQHDKTVQNVEEGHINEDTIKEQTNSNKPSNKKPVKQLGEATVTFVDVGQGDGQIIQTDDFVAVIDAGTPSKAKDMMEVLDSNGVKKIDVVIATHPHNDHIGGLPTIIDNYDIGMVVMPEIAEKDIPTTQIYEKLLVSIANKEDIEIMTPGYHKTAYVSDDGQVELKILSDEEAGISTGNLNNYSVVAQFRYGNTKFLFTGDAEKEEEAVVLENVNASDLRSDVFAAGHHGSKTSNTESFVKAVEPEIVIISAGEGNKYRHPHKQAIDRFKKISAEIHETEKEGNIVVGTDGKSVYVK